MCIKIKKNDQLKDYNTEESLEDQLCGSEQIVVNYRKSKDLEVDHFVKELEKMVKNGSSYELDIKVINNNNLSTAKAKRKIKQIEKNLKMNKVIKGISICHQESDRKLEEIVSFIKDRMQCVKESA